jgi:hypothetical protein
MHLFDNMTYHDYVYNPDSHYPKVMKLKAILEKYAPEMPLRQGENGAPSGARMGGALGDYDWSELSQAKWNTRRMLGDLGHDIESSVFTIIDIAYTAGPIKRLNVKGLIQSDMTKKAIRPKLAYHAVQNVASIFDDTLERIKNIRDTYNSEFIPENQEDVAMTKKHRPKPCGLWLPAQNQQAEYLHDLDGRSNSNQFRRKEKPEFYFHQCQFRASRLC